LKDLWPNTKYYYKIGHRLVNGSYIWGQLNYFKASPYPGHDSLQRVIIFGDMGKAERDGSNAYSNYQPDTLNTTDRLIEDLENIDIVLNHPGASALPAMLQFVLMLFLPESP
jgi:hypothetical protein